MLGCLTHVKQANHFKQFDMGTYVRTLETLGFKNSDFESWMPEAKNRETYGQRELNIFSTSLLVHTQDQMINAYTPPSVLTLTKYLNMKSLALRER